MNPAAKEPWEGVFETFAEAGADVDVFEGDIWLGKVTERARVAREASEGAPIPAVATTTDYALPFAVALTAHAGHPVRILDVGGGMATSYFPLRAMLPKDRLIDFVIVENDAICARSTELLAGHPEVHFRTQLPTAPEQFHVVHFGSSLHYIDDWKGTLATVTGLSPEYLLFVDLPAADNRTFVTTQRFHDRRIPVRFWNADEFIATVCALGFELLLKARYRGYYLGAEAELPTANFDTEHRLTYTSQLIFRRLGATSGE